MAPTTNALRWTFTVQTPLGPTRSSFQIDEDALRYESDDLFDEGAATVHWDAVVEGGTAAMAGMGGRGGPDLPRWVPGELEWLTLSRAGARGDARDDFMRRLPSGADRDAIVAAVRSRLGARWIGERVPLADARHRLRIASRQWSAVKVAGIVLAVLGLLALSIILLAVLLTPLVIVPAGLALGGWMIRKGIRGYRDAMAASTVPVAGADWPALGLVRLEGRAVTDAPLSAAVSGRPAVWWDVTVCAWYESDSEDSGGWRQLAARYGGNKGIVELEGPWGRLPVWLKDAQLVVKHRRWESHRDALPAPGLALLDALGFPWDGPQRLQVTEEWLEADGPLYVVGTLDERRRLPCAEPGAGERVRRALRTGEWRRAVVGALPRSMRAAIAVFIGFLDMLIGIGSARTRPQYVQAMAPPPISPDGRLVWKGRDGHPFIVSDQAEQEVLAALRKRSMIFGGVGIAMVCFAVYTLAEGLGGG
jgi:hypothetical protein